MTLVEVLLRHAIERPDATAYVFLRDDGAEETLTFGQLEERARAIAGQLQALARVGERAVLLYQPGLDFIEAILACFFARLVAVPVAPLRNPRELPRLLGILEDSGARLVLSNSATRNAADRTLGTAPAAGGPIWICTDTVPTTMAETFHLELPDDSSLAFLQYTSGSTGNPKGVMVTHANLIHNQQVIRAACEHDQSTVFVGWLPFYHDMGLIGNVFQPLFLGRHVVLLMSPMTFLVAPVRLAAGDLQVPGRPPAAGRTSRTSSACTEGHPRGASRGSTCRSWRVAFNGAEPVQAARRWSASPQVRAVRVPARGVLSLLRARRDARCS